MDWIFRYGNQALAELEKLPLEELIDHAFGSIFPDMDAKRPRAYERTAYTACQYRAVRTAAVLAAWALLRFSNAKGIPRSASSFLPFERKAAAKMFNQIEHFCPDGADSLKQIWYTSMRLAHSNRFYPTELFQMPDARKANLPQGKDLITIGIFSAIYFVLNFICMLISGPHPLVWILMPMNIAIVTGIPFLPLRAKVRKFGAVLLMGLLTGMIYYMTGQFTVILLITFGCACLLAEAARAMGKYRSAKANTAAFALFSLGMTGSPLPIWVMRGSFLAQIRAQGMAEDYLAELERVSSPLMLVVMFAAYIRRAFPCVMLGWLMVKTVSLREFVVCMRKLRLPQKLLQLKAEGKTIVIAEHRLYFLTELMDRAVYMKSGRIRRAFPRGEFLALTERELARLGLRSLRPAELRLPNAHRPSGGDLICTGLSCGYKKNPNVVERLSFSLRRGTVAALTGHNGVGKSTLTRCLCGLLPEQASSISLDGQLLKAKARQRTCYLVMQASTTSCFPTAFSASASSPALPRKESGRF